MGEMVKTENAEQPFEIKVKKIELIAESLQD